MRLDAIVITDQNEAGHLHLAVVAHARRLRRDGIPPPDFLADLADELLEFARSGAPSKVQVAEPLNHEIAVDQFGWSTLKEAADAIGISESYAARLCRTGRLAAVKHHKTWTVDPAAITAYRRKQQ